MEEYVSAYFIKQRGAPPGMKLFRIPTSTHTEVSIPPHCFVSPFHEHTLPPSPYQFIPTWRAGYTLAQLPLMFCFHLKLFNLTLEYCKPLNFLYYTVNMWLTVSEKSVFPTNFGCGCFQGNLFSFEKHKGHRRFHLMSYVWRCVLMLLLSS